MPNDYQRIINEMIEQKETESLDDKRDNVRQRNIRMAGIINDYLHRRFNRYVIITGGLSVEYYTKGNYTTQDIDFVTPSYEDLNTVLLDLGFESIGKYWQYEKLEIFVELVSNNAFDGSSKEPTKFETQDRLEVAFTDVADILLDRIRGIVYWNTKDYEYWSYQLLKEHRSSISDEYMYSRLEGPSEIDEYRSLVQWVDDPTEISSKVKTFEWILRNSDVEFIYKQIGNTHIFWFPLYDEELEQFGEYIGIQVLRNVSLLMYNNDEEELEKTDLDPRKILGRINYDSNGKSVFGLIKNSLEEAELI